MLNNIAYQYIRNLNYHIYFNIIGYSDNDIYVINKVKEYINNNSHNLIVLNYYYKDVCKYGHINNNVNEYLKNDKFFNRIFLKSNLYKSNLKVTHINLWYLELYNKNTINNIITELRKEKINNILNN